MMKLLFKRGSLLLCVGLCLCLFNTLQVRAVLDLEPAELVAPEGSYNVQAEQGSAGSGTFVEAANSFNDGSPKYYLVTRDPSKQKQTTVNFQGQNYPLSEVLFTTTGDLYTLKISGQAYGFFDYRARTENCTFFFDGGEFFDSSHTNYTSFSKSNLSLLGLKQNVVLKKAAYPSTAAKDAIDCVERYNLSAPDIYLENIIFDGSGKDLLPLGGKPTAVGKNRGEYAFMLSTGSAGFVMKNCVIRNYGKDLNQPGGLFGFARYRKNVALNFYRNAGPCTIDGLRVENVKTKENFPLIALNQAKDIYFRNISLDASAAHPYSRSIKMESARNDESAVALSANKAVFAGTLALADDAYHNHIYVQDYRYQGLYLPASLRYTAYRAANGSDFEYSSLSFAELPDVFIDDRGNLYGNKVHAILDQQDKCWVVREGLSTSVSEQISKILQVCALANRTGVNVPPPNIKLLAQGAVDSFQVNLPANLSQFTGEINLMALQGPDSPLTDLSDPERLIPLAAQAEIQLNLGAANAQVKLHNFDFHEQARYSLSEVTQGINTMPASALTDPNEAAQLPAYPTYSTYCLPASPKVSNATATNFANCRFTALLAPGGIEIKSKGSLPAAVLQGHKIRLRAGLTASENSYSSPEVPAADFSADDQRLMWFSSDPTIATVDESGKVTGLALGTVQIYVKALDSNNQGEVERPWDVIELNVVAEIPYTVRYFVNEQYLEGEDEVGTVTPGNNLITPADLIDKCPPDCVFDTLQSTNLPFQVTATTNVINVFYQQAEALKLPYTVRYYVDGIYQEAWTTSGVVTADVPLVYSVAAKTPANCVFAPNLSTPLPFEVSALASVIDIHYISQPHPHNPSVLLPYTVEYYLDGVHLEGEDVHDTVSSDLPFVTAVPAKCPDTAVLDQTNSSFLPFTVSQSEAFIRIHYVTAGVPAEHFNYRLVYFLDGIYQQGWDEIGTVAQSNPQLTAIPDKTTAQSRIDPNYPLVLPLDIPGDRTIIPIYYESIALTPTVLPYTVRYYYDDVYSEGSDEQGVVPLHDTVVAAVPEKAREFDTRDISQSSVLPFTVSAENSVINVFYKAAERLPYTVRYFLDGVYQKDWDVTASVLKAEPVLSAYPNKLPANYGFDASLSTPLPFTVSSESSVVSVYYYSNEQDSEDPTPPTVPATTKPYEPRPSYTRPNPGVYPSEIIPSWGTIKPTAEFGQTWPDTNPEHTLAVQSQALPLPAGGQVSPAAPTSSAGLSGLANAKTASKAVPRTGETSGRSLQLLLLLSAVLALLWQCKRLLRQHC